MSNNVITWAKNNPGKTVLGLGGLGVAIYLILNSGGGGQTVTYSNAGGGMSPAEMQMAMQGQQLNAQLSGAQIGANAQIALATINQQTQLAGADYTLKLAKEDNATNYAIAQLASAIQLQNITTGADVANKQTAAQLQLGIESQNTTRAAIESSYNQALATNKMMGEYFVGQQNIQIQGIMANRDIAIQQSKDSVSINKQNTKASMVDSITSPLGKLFCDVRIKTLRECISTEECAKAIDTIPLDKWVYIAGSVADDGAKTHVGTYAQDFYRALNAADAEMRTEIDNVDLMGAMLGAIKELRNVSGK